MKLLFDHGTPVPLRSALVGHSAETAYERGWSTLGNGALLAAAEGASFDALITTDQNLPSQQNLARRSIAVVVLPTTDWRQIREHVVEIALALNAVQPGASIRVDW